MRVPGRQHVQRRVDQVRRRHVRVDQVPLQGRGLPVLAERRQLPARPQVLGGQAVRQRRRRVSGRRRGLRVHGGRRLQHVGAQVRGRRLLHARRRRVRGRHAGLPVRGRRLQRRPGVRRLQGRGAVHVRVGGRSAGARRDRSERAGVLRGGRAARRGGARVVESEIVQ